MKTEEISSFAQKCFEKCPTIVLGSGASIPHGLPSMDDLSHYLKKEVKNLGANESDAWKSISDSLDAGKHLEQALEGKELPVTLLTKIVGLTWDCVNQNDAKLMHHTVSTDPDFPLGKLLVRMFNSTINKIHIVTTNYDRVAEFACNSMKVLFQTGFAPGYIQKWEGNGGIKYQHGMKPSRVVKIWKVHGSLDWFRTLDDRIVGLPVFELPPEEYTPLILTPGINKYKQIITQEPFRTTINGADNALSKASALLCIGYGFRDQHINLKIFDRCREENVPIIVLAKELTNEAKDFLKEKAGSNYLGIEESNNGSFIYSPNDPNGVEVSEKNLWTLRGFNELVL